jgi:hypothetical protein
MFTNFPLSSNCYGWLPREVNLGEKFDQETPFIKSDEEIEKEEKLQSNRIKLRSALENIKKCPEGAELIEKIAKEDIFIDFCSPKEAPFGAKFLVSDNSFKMIENKEIKISSEFESNRQVTSLEELIIFESHNILNIESIKKLNQMVRSQEISIEEYAQSFEKEEFEAGKRTNEICNACDNLFLLNGSISIYLEDFNEYLEVNEKIGHTQRIRDEARLMQEGKLDFVKFFKFWA